MLVKVLIFDGDGGLLEVDGNIVDGGEGAVFVFEDFVEQVAVTVVDLGGKDRGGGSQIGGVGEIFEDLKVEEGATNSYGYD